jgi:hypothetical protein
MTLTPPTPVPVEPIPPPPAPRLPILDALSDDTADAYGPALRMETSIVRPSPISRRR